jgi:hypothetical protein
MEKQLSNTDGFRIDDYFVCFPEGDFITEDEEGMAIAVDIYRITDNNDLEPMKPGSVTEELQSKIESWINTALTRAIEQAEAEYKDKDK